MYFLGEAMKDLGKHKLASIQIQEITLKKRTDHFYQHSQGLF